MKRTLKSTANVTKTCAHNDRIVTINSGLVREVCRACGHVSFHYRNDTTGDQAEILIKPGG